MGAGLVSAETELDHAVLVVLRDAGATLGDNHLQAHLTHGRGYLLQLQHKGGGVLPVETVLHIPCLDLSLDWADKPALGTG